MKAKIHNMAIEKMTSVAFFSPEFPHPFAGVYVLKDKVSSGMYTYSFFIIPLLE